MEKRAKTVKINIEINTDHRTAMRTIDANFDDLCPAIANFLTHILQDFDYAKLNIDAEVFGMRKLRS